MTTLETIVAYLIGVGAGWVLRSALAQEERNDAYWAGHAAGVQEREILESARTAGKVDQ